MERRRRWSADTLLWAGLAIPVVGVDRIGLNEPRGAWPQLAGLAVLAVAAATWRARPLAAFAGVAGLSLASAPALLTLAYGPALAVFALLLGLRALGTRPALVAFGAVGLAGTVRIAVLGVDPDAEWLVLAGTLLFGVVFPWLGGRYWRQSRELAAAGWARAAQLEREQRIAEDRARLRERARIAQDMHDSLGHELSLIALRAGVLQVAPDLPDHHRTAAAALRAAASDATDRLHGIIGLLREEDDDEPVPLIPAGESVEELVARAANSGLPVRWEPGPPGEPWAPDANGNPGETEQSTRSAYSDPGPALNPGSPAERTVHRVVREALTNAARHAPGAAVTVAARREAAGTTVTVTNGRATAAGSASSAGGTGLVGLRTAVEGVGGRFEAGLYGDGFRIRAYMPVDVPVDVPVGGAVGESGSAPAAPAAEPDSPFTHARSRVVVALAGAVTAGVVLVGGAFAWYAYTETHSVLEPGAYAELRLGTPLGEAVRLLPDRMVDDPPVDRAPAAPQDAVDCRYYRASGELLVSVEHFRLCFDDEERLIAKDVIPKAGTAGHTG
jgi:signal transduction histidine kinase